MDKQSGQEMIENDVALHTINGLALCAGAGGLDLAMHIAEPRYRTVCYVEREAGAAASLVVRMEDQTLDQAPVWDDLGTYEGKPWCGLVDCLTSGDPCQPNSNAGKGLGEDDDRWLIDRLIRVIEEVRPYIVFRENVTGNADGQLAALIPALDRLGYCVAAGIFAAAETGASHERQRLFILAHREGPGQQSGGRGRRITEEYAEPFDSSSNMADAQGQRRREAGECSNSRDPRTGQPGTGLANAGRTGLQGGKRNGPSGERNGAASHGSVAELCSARLPLFAPGPGDIGAWREILETDPLLEPAICRTVDGVAHRNDRLRLCGNGVSPLAGAYAYRTLSALLTGIDRGTATGNVLTK